MSLSPLPFILPAGYPRIKVVSSFDELVATRLEGGVNALCWQRTLPGDFRAVVEQLGRLDQRITSLDETRLRSLHRTGRGRAAVDVLKADLQRLEAHGLSPSLDCIQEYPKDDEPGAFPTDVYSFHADSATVETDTYLCTYTEVASEGLRNEEACRCIDVPDTRAALLRLYGGADDGAFREYLAENCYDLHYAALPHAQPFSFGLGNMWRIAVDYPGCPVPPCIHRAPATRRGQPPRLLLIS